MSSPVLRAENICKSYRESDHDLTVLKGASITVERGERVAIVGLSGSGKSTLLHVLGGLDHPDSGSVTIMGEDIFRVTEQRRGEIRNQHLGFVYQFHHLLPEFSALENVAMPLLIGRVVRSAAYHKARSMLESVGLEERADHKPAKLSGGERQRVAIARALVTEPACVLADEPTGNLDEETAEVIGDLMLDLSASLQTSFVVVTHNTSLADRMDRKRRLHNGVLEDL